MKREPVAIAAAVRAVVATVLLALEVAPELAASVLVSVEAVLAIFVRSRVTPVDKHGLPL